MLRSSLLTASAVLLCSSAFAQQTPQLAQKHKLLPNIKNGGVYHVTTGTWDRGGNVANFGPGTIFRNDTHTGYFGFGWEGTPGHASGILPGTSNTTFVTHHGGGGTAGLVDTYKVNGFMWFYCSNGSGPMIDWTLELYDAYAFCDNTLVTGTTDGPYNLAGTVPLPSFPRGGCWLFTIDLAGGAEVDMEADGGGFAAYAGYQGIQSNKDFMGLTLTWAHQDAGTTFTIAGPVLGGDPDWVGTGSGTCYQTAFNCGRQNPNCQATQNCNGGGLSQGSGAGVFHPLGVPPFSSAIVDAFGVSAATGGGCFWFGGYVNSNGCAGSGFNPLSSWYSNLFIDCNDPGGNPCPDMVYCAPTGTNCPGTQVDCNTASIGISGCEVSAGSIVVSFDQDPNLFIDSNFAGYLNVSLGGTGTTTNAISDGVLCIVGGGAIGRYNGADTKVIDANGHMDLDILNSQKTGGCDIPLITNATGINYCNSPGQTYTMQWWFRRSMMNPISSLSGFSQAMQVTIN